jgi:sulfate transport system substrate-binding protein
VIRRGGSEDQAREFDYARAYLEFLSTGAAQENFAKHGYRPINSAVLKKNANRLPDIELFPITLIARNWEDADEKYFGENGIFDLIYTPKANQ